MSIVKLQQAKPNPLVVDKLEEMLKRAKTGELKAVIIYGDLGNETLTAVAGRFDVNTLIAVAERFKREAFIMLDSED